MREPVLGLTWEHSGPRKAVLKGLAEIDALAGVYQTKEVGSLNQLS